MDRRDALKAFLALPATATLTRAQVKVTDVLVIEVDALLSNDSKAYIAEMVRQVFGQDQRVMVLDGGVKLKIAEKADA